MTITDVPRATACLERIGYYRLSAYWFPFRLPDANTAPGATPYLDDFKPGSNFSDAMALYVFDKKLRLLVLDAAERIEVGLRVDVALLLSRRDPWAHRDAAQLHSRFANGPPQRCHASWLQRQDEGEARSKEEFATHFRQKYSGQMPLWMAIELSDFGMLSVFFSGMKDVDVTAIANKYGLPRRDLLKSWLRSINYVRNVCAHHNRLWNRGIVEQPGVPRLNELPELNHLSTDSYAQRRFYAVACVLRWLLRCVHPTSTWPDRLKAHIATFPNSPHVNLRNAGFPANWDTLPFWN